MLNSRWGARGALHYFNQSGEINMDSSFLTYVVIIAVVIGLTAAFYASKK